MSIVTTLFSLCQKFENRLKCTGVCLAITMLQYYICLGIVLTVILVLGLLRSLTVAIFNYYVTYGCHGNVR